MGFLGDAWDWTKDNALGVAAAPFTGGLSLLPGLGTAVLGEDTMSKIPLIGPLFGSESDEQKALIAKQEQLAREAKLRRTQVQQQSLNALGQSMLAFNPRNQMMAQMFGPEAAFQPSQMAAMIANPQGMPEMDPSIDQTSTDPRVTAEQQRVMAERDVWRQQEERRKQQLMQGIQPVGPGPAPLDPRRPAPARRY